MKISAATLFTLLGGLSVTYAAATPGGCPGERAIVKNGGFECGLSPWTVATGGRATYSVSSPGSSSSKAFDLQTTAKTADNSPPGIQQTVQVTAGKAYTLSFYTYFGDADAGFIGVMFNGQAKLTVDARDQACCQIWNKKTYSFTADSSSLTIRFEFLSGKAGTDFKLDGISLA